MPFTELPVKEELKVTGTVSLRDNVLHLHFTIFGNIDRLCIPKAARRPLRLDNLWQTTCFETFFRRRGELSYHEVNISPCGCWNLYHFSDYRKAMRQEKVVEVLPIEVSVNGSFCGVRGALSLEGIINSGEILAVGMSCVVEHKTGVKSYWALSHPGEKPDFHHQGSFLIEV